MAHEHAPSAVAQRPSESSESIRFRRWNHRIQGAGNADDLVRLVREYLESWQPEQLQVLPVDVGCNALATLEDIPARAVIAVQAELRMPAGTHADELLREMALTLCAAAARIRILAIVGRSLTLVRAAIAAAAGVHEGSEPFPY
jgi:hypothetical protein